MRHTLARMRTNILAHIEMKRRQTQTTSYIVYAYTSEMLNEAERFGAVHGVSVPLQKAATTRAAIDQIFAYVSTLNSSEPFVAERLWREIETKARDNRLSVPIPELRSSPMIAALNAVENMEAK